MSQLEIFILSSLMFIPVVHYKGKPIQSLIDEYYFSQHKQYRIITELFELRLPVQYFPIYQMIKEVKSQLIVPHVFLKKIKNIMPESNDQIDQKMILSFAKQASIPQETLQEKIPFDLLKNITITQDSDNHSETLLIKPMKVNISELDTIYKYVVDNKCYLSQIIDIIKVSCRFFRDKKGNDYFKILELEHQVSDYVSCMKVKREIIDIMTILSRKYNITLVIP